eukprot:s2528_g12.t1
MPRTNRPVVSTAMKSQSAKGRRSNLSKQSSTRNGVKQEKDKKQKKPCLSVIDQLKRLKTPYRGLSRLPRPAEIRRSIQAPSEEGRSSKRKHLIATHNGKPRTQQQTFLEQAAISPRTAVDYQFRGNFWLEQVLHRPFSFLIFKCFNRQRFDVQTDSSESFTRKRMLAEQHESKLH